MPSFLASTHTDASNLRFDTVKRIAKWMNPQDLLDIPSDLPECPGSLALLDELARHYLWSKLGLSADLSVEVQSMLYSVGYKTQYWF